ncbi:BTAD domain-containing putative transcriptional regulator [Streptomyces sp. NPDC049555]|uniref:BTAD domain-containing putative transcriptional regulator n=1 Tax=unclassified Streptomyces TaxID=2593676 RepID=UPI003424EA8A
MPIHRNGTTATTGHHRPGGTGTFGAQLRWYRGRAGLTQRELAEKSGLSVRALRDIEQGRVQQPQTRTLQRLMECLGLDPEEVRRAGTGTAPDADADPDAHPPDDRLRIGILGPLTIGLGGTELDVRAAKPRRLLALLALHHPQPVGLGEITRALWPTDPPPSYQGLIHTYVGQVRRLLLPPGAGPATPAASYLARTHTGYALCVERDQVDLTRFEDLSARARQARAAGDTAAAHDLAGRAYRCWRGPLLSDEPLLTQDPAATAAAKRRIDSLLLYADLAMELRRPEQVVHPLRLVAEQEPLHEGLQARLMVALASCGEQSAALKVFTEVTHRLDRELGIAPGDEIRRAHLQVLRQELPWPRGEWLARLSGRGERPAPPQPRHPPSAPPSCKPSQLPGEARIHVGRAAETRQLDRLLLSPGEWHGQVPVALLTGLPGVGKTALALRWAHRVRERFPDGQLYVDLHGHSVRPPLPAAAALTLFLRALGVADDRLPTAPDEAANTYRTLLSGRRVLIVLDNAGTAEQVRPLIPGNAECAVLVTSRNTLSGLVAREGIRRIGLDALGPDEALVLLTRLLGRARTEAEPQAAAELVRYCGGLPLAIRIVAAHLAENPGVGLAEYCSELGDDGPVRGLRVEGDRLSSVEATFELSYKALPEPVRRFFRLLATTDSGNVTALTMAERARMTPCEAIRMLRTLVDASLVQEYAHGCFRMPDLLRRYARVLVKSNDASHLRVVRSSTM